MQNSNPKHSGFFLKPSEKNPDYHSHSHLVHIAQESEFPGSLKRGLVIQPKNGDESGFDSGRRLEWPVVCAVPFIEALWEGERSDGGEFAAG